MTRRQPADVEWSWLMSAERLWRPIRKPEVSIPMTAMEFARLSDEPAADFSALLVHRDAGPGRTLRTTAMQVGRSESTLRRVAARWNWAERLQAFDSAVLQKVAAAGVRAAEDRHREQLLAFRDTQQRRAEQLGATAELLMEFVVDSVRQHLSTGTVLQPGQLAAALGAAARSLEASGSTAATALGVDELMEQLMRDDHVAPDQAVVSRTGTRTSG